MTHPARLVDTTIHVPVTVLDALYRQVDGADREELAIRRGPDGALYLGVRILEPNPTRHLRRFLFLPAPDGVTVDDLNALPTDAYYRCYVPEEARTLHHDGDERVITFNTQKNTSACPAGHTRLGQLDAYTAATMRLALTQESQRDAATGRVRRDPVTVAIGVPHMDTNPDTFLMATTIPSDDPSDDPGTTVPGTYIATRLAPPDDHSDREPSGAPILAEDLYGHVHHITAGPVATALAQALTWPDLEIYAANEQWAVNNMFGVDPLHPVPWYTMGQIELFAPGHGILHLRTDTPWASSRHAGRATPTLDMVVLAETVNTALHAMATQPGTHQDGRVMTQTIIGEAPVLSDAKLTQLLAQARTPQPEEPGLMTSIDTWLKTLAAHIAPQRNNPVD